MRAISKTKMLIYQAKAKLDEKCLLVKSHIFKTKQLKKKACEESAWESRIPRSYLVLDLCGIEAYIASLRNRISIEGKSWTKMEYGIVARKHALF